MTRQWGLTEQKGWRQGGISLPPPPPPGCQQRGEEEDRASMQHTTTLRGPRPELLQKQKKGGCSEQPRDSLSRLRREWGVEVKRVGVVRERSRHQ